MINLRTLLKNILASLAKWAIKKHHMELIVILGVNGTEITKELSYYVLSNRFKVRRVTNKPWWDFSIPLSILGYKDRRRTPFEWILLIIRSYIYLLIGPKNPSSIIINLNYLHKDTMHFWSKIIFPDILILSNFNRLNKELEVFINNTHKKGGKIIVNESSQISKDKKFLIIGKSKGVYLKSLQSTEGIQLSHGKENILIQQRSISFIPAESVEFAFALGLYKGISIEDCFEYIQQFDFPSFLSKIKNNLYKSEY